MWLKKLSVMLAIFILSMSTFAADKQNEFQEDKHYQRISISADGAESAKNKIVVLEFFNYGCPWCFRVEAPLQKWRKHLPSYVEFKRIPVVFERSWEVYAKAYYLASALKINDKIDPLLFDLIAEKKQNLKSSDAMIKFFVAQGVDEKIARSAFESSLSMDAQMAAGTKIMKDYQISAIPSWVIDGKYKTDLSMVNADINQLFKVLDYLVKDAKKHKDSKGNDKAA